MASVVKFTKAKGSYRPSSALVSLIKDLLQHQKKEQKLEEKIDTGEMGREQIEAEKDVLRKERDNLIKRKVDVLNKHIFPAMANLTVLVENIQKEAYIREIFDDDLRALFLIKSNQNKTDKSIFERFIEASVKTNMTILMGTERGIEPDILLTDYRLILCDIMLKSIYEMMQEVGPHKFDDRRFVEDTMIPDFKPVRAWTRLLSREAWKSEVARGAGSKLRFQMKRRPALF